MNGKLMMAMVAVLAAVAANAQETARPSPARPFGGLRRPGMAARPDAARPAADAAKPGAEGADENEPKKMDEAPPLNWDAAAVDIILQAYGDEVNKTILKDPQVPNANITLKGREGQKLTKAEYLEAIEVVLEMNGIHLEEYGENFIRALPRKDVRKEGIPLYMDGDMLNADIRAGKIKDGKVVSVMITFKNIGTEEAQKALEGFKSNSGILLVFERTNSILATDTYQNIGRMLEIAHAIDIATPVTEVVEYIQIRYASANDIKTVIDNIVQESMKEQEKDKRPANQTPSSFASTAVRPLIGRPGTPQPSAPANQPSLVMSVSDADRGMIRGKVVTIADERSNKILLITSATNMKFFKEVIAALDVETTPDVQVKVYRLKYADAEDVSDMINDLIGNSSSSKSGGGRGNQNQNAAHGTSGSVTRSYNSMQSRSSANQRSGESKAGELNKDNVTVLADKRINGIVVMARTEDIPTLEQIIESMDIKLSQVLIETAIIEVTLGDDLQTGIDWMRLGDKQARKHPDLDPFGQRRYHVLNEEGGYSGLTMSAAELAGSDYKNMGYTLSDIASELTSWTRGGLLNTDGSVTSMLGGGGGTAAGLLDTLVGIGTNAVSTLSPAGSGLNLFLKSDALNLGAIIKASKTDSRAKYIASPVVMTVDNKEATIEATEARKFFNGFETSSSYSTYVRTPKYDSKDIGITIKVTPKINPNGTVMLEIEEEYSQLGAGQSILVDEGNGKTGSATIDTSLTRKMSADILLDNMQTVILGGLTETYTSEKETGIPILKDIPWIGKWLFGSVSQSESRKELLVFMTPYVLNDADAAQAEAIRRKKTMSDPSPWEDHGWSGSALADPVARKEQLRRLTDEWKKQDEERQTKLAIEKAKVDRAKKLKALSKEERDVWIKMHKDELEKEEREELEEKMLDPKSQEELKNLAESIRERKLTEAEDELKKMEEMTAAQNERGKLEAEKAKQEVAPEGETPAAEPAPVAPVAEPVKPETPAEPVVEPAAPETAPEAPAEPVAPVAPEAEPAPAEPVAPEAEPAPEAPAAPVTEPESK